jgi:nucleoside-diphosphate-sugar epimerase
MSRTAFVTGGTGFLGLNLIEQLAAGGWRVTALHRANSNLKYLKRLAIGFAEGDVTDAKSMRTAMPEGVDAVFHVAGDTSLWKRGDAQQDQVNIDGTRNVVEAALACNAKRLIHTSSISAYGMFSGRLDEKTRQLGGESWINYQRSKFAAEEVVREGIRRGLDAVIMNPGSILGRGDISGWARIIRLVCAGKLPGIPPGAGCFCDVREVAKAHITAVERGRSGDNYILCGTDASFLKLVQTIGAVTGHAVPSRATPAIVLRLVGRLGAIKSSITGKAPTLTPESASVVIWSRTCDSGKAMRELDYRAADLHSMVEQSYEWLKQEGLLGI